MINIFKRPPQHLKTHTIVLVPGKQAVKINDHAHIGPGMYTLYIDTSRASKADVVNLHIDVNPAGGTSANEMIRYLSTEMPDSSVSQLWSIDLPPCSGFSISIKSVAGREIPITINVWRIQ